MGVGFQRWLRRTASSVTTAKSHCKVTLPCGDDHMIQGTEHRKSKEQKKRVMDLEAQPCSPPRSSPWGCCCPHPRMPCPSTQRCSAPKCSQQLQPDPSVCWLDVHRHLSPTASGMQDAGCPQELALTCLSEMRLHAGSTGLCTHLPSRAPGLRTHSLSED